jgi:hypothetical protein
LGSRETPGGFAGLFAAIEADGRCGGIGGIPLANASSAPWCWGSRT